MNDSSKKDDDAKNPGPDETWVKKLGGTPANVTIYVGLLRKSPSDENLYELYLTLDMGSYLQIQKTDVVYIEELPADKSPFGGLGGARVYVRIGAKIKSVKTATNTFDAGSDEFDLDIRLGSRGGAGVARLRSGTDCAVFDCLTIEAPTWADTTCQRVLSADCTNDTCGVTRCGQTCATCVTCGTCNTQCGTCQTDCGTCHTQCGPCLTGGATQCRPATCGPACGVVKG
jgi:hypothetical protein